MGDWTTLEVPKDALKRLRKAKALMEFQEPRPCRVLTMGDAITIMADYYIKGHKIT